MSAQVRNLAHSAGLGARRLVRRSRLLQIGLLSGLWLAGNAISDAAHLPIPGGIVGMLMALVLLASRRMSLVMLQRGADWLIADMLLFFVPAVLAIMAHHELFGLLGLKILTVIVVGTSSVMAVTAFTVDVCHRATARARVPHGGAHPFVE